MSAAREELSALAAHSETRVQLWTDFLRRVGARQVLEVGVYRGAFAARILGDCPGIETYYMIDP
jgi:predicted O-methyltransferase YrrM